MSDLGLADQADDDGLGRDLYMKRNVTVLSVSKYLCVVDSFFYFTNKKKIWLTESTAFQQQNHAILQYEDTRWLLVLLDNTVRFSRWMIKIKKI